MTGSYPELEGILSKIAIKNCNGINILSHFVFFTENVRTKVNAGKKRASTAADIEQNVADQTEDNAWMEVGSHNRNGPRYVSSGVEVEIFNIANL